MEEELQKIADSIELWQEQRSAIRERCAAWIQSPMFHRSFYDDAHAPRLLREALEHNHGKAKAEELWESLRKQGTQSPELWQQYQRLATEGQVVFAHGVIVNPQFRKETNRSLPCLTLVSVDQESLGVACTGLMASLIGDLYRSGEGAKERPQIKALVDDDRFQLFRRRLLPEEETGNLTAIFLDIQLRNSWMPPLEVPFIPLLLLPGAGAVVQIPWSIATGTPPIPGTMAGGRWADFSKLPPPGPPPLPPPLPGTPAVRAGKAKKGSARTGIIIAIFVAVTFGGAVLALILIPFPLNAPEDKPVHWAQAPALRRKISVIPAKDYEPLIGEGLAGSGFLFHAKPDLFLVATSRHQFENPNHPPKTLFDLDDLEISLDTQEVARTPESQIQLVSAISQPATSLEFDSSDVIEYGDELWLLRDKEKQIVGKVTSPGRYPLTSPPVVVRMSVSTTENVTGASGGPVVQAKTGRVVGVMQAADRAQSPTFLEFETLHLPPIR